ncbi:MAG: pentapeptide repeat-containing protein [Flavobacteriaceae bacterium]|nr:pentapeptide repeat-containing protein [Flavobacteriaceae bacterium]
MEEISYKERFCWLKFQRVQEEEKATLLQFLQEHTDFDAVDGEEAITIIKSPLVCYENVHLYVVQDHRERISQRQLQTEFLLHKLPDATLAPEQLHPLYRRVNEIHAFNRAIEFKITSIPQAVAYLRFFTEAIESSDGPFYIIDGVDYTPGSILSDADIYDITTALEKHPELLTPIEERTDMMDDYFEIFAPVLYGDSLYKTTFAMSSTGQVKMIGFLPLPPAIHLSYRTIYDHDPFPIYKNTECISITNEEFKEALLSDTVEPLHHLLRITSPDPENPVEPVPFVKITGNLFLRKETINFGIYIPSWLTLVFEKDVGFKNCVFKGDVDLNGCRFLDGFLSFNSAHIHGYLNLENAIIYKPIYSQYPNSTTSLMCRNLTIEGDFYANRLRLFHRGISMDYAKIEGSFNMKDALIDSGVTCFRLTVKGYLNFESTTIRGSLNLRNARLKSDCGLSHIKVDGSVYMRSIQIGVSLTFSGTRVLQNVTLDFADVRGGIFMKIASKKHTQIEGNLQMSSVNCNWSHIEILGTKIHGSLIMISPQKVAALYLRGDTIGIGGFSQYVNCEIDWGLYISNLTLRGDFNCYGLRLGGTRNLPAKKIEQGDFNLVNSSIKGAVNFSQPASMPENLAYYVMIDDEQYDVVGLGQREHHEPEIAFRNITELFQSNFTSLLDLNEETILDYVRFFVFHIYTRKNKEIYLVETHEDLVWDTEFNRHNRPEILEKILPLRLVKHEDHTFELEASYIDHDRHLHHGSFIVNAEAETIGEHLHIRSNWKSNKRLKVPLSVLFDRKPFYLSNVFTHDTHFWTEVPEADKNVFLKKVANNTLFDVTKYYNSLYKAPLPFLKKGVLYAAKANLIALKYPTEIQGNFNFNGVNIRGNINLSNIKVSKKLGLQHTTVSGNITAQALAASFGQKDFLEYAVCSHAELASLEVKGDADFSGLRVLKRGEYHGDFNAESLQVQGTLSLHQNDPKTQLQLDGTLDLSNACIENLLLSEATFNNHTHKVPGSDSLLNLERLTVAFFDWQGGFPNHIKTKIRDLDVSTWSRDGLNNLKALLEADTSEELKRNAFTKIESTLRNQGYEEKAEEVYKVMWKRIKNQQIDGHKKQLRSRMIFAFRSWFGYGRKQAFTSFWIFVVFLFISLVIFSNRENVVMTPGGIEDPEHYTFKEVSNHPEKEAWGMGNSMWFALRYNVPIIPFTSLDQWQPNPKGINFFGMRSTRFTAQHYAHAIELSHWIIWSIFLIYLSGILRRGEGRS